MISFKVPWLNKLSIIKNEEYSVVISSWLRVRLSFEILKSLILVI